MSGTGTPPPRKRDKVRHYFKCSRKPSSATPTALQPSRSLSQPNFPAAPDHKRQPGHQFLQRALERLDPEVQETIKELNRDDEDITSTIARALAAANNQKKSCEAKRWKWTIRGHEVSLQDVADKTIFWLGRCKDAGDVAVNADPIHAGLPWAGLRLILEAVVSERHQMAALLAGLETVFYTPNRLRLYYPTYFIHNLSSGLDSEAVSNLEDALIRTYAVVLGFLGRAIHTLQQNSAKRAVKSIWKIDDYEDLERKCKEMEQEAYRDASVCDQKLAAQDRQHIMTRLKDGLKILEDQREIRASLNTLHNRFDYGRLPIAQGAAFDSYEEGQNAQCLPGTRVKLLQLIIDWFNNPDSKQIYWVNGMAGTGKSTISRTVARDLQKQGRLGASFFFKRNEADRRNASKLFTTLAAQLAENVPSIQPSIFDLLDKHPGILQKAPIDQFDDLILTPLTNLSRDERIFIVIDALDECDHKDVRVIFPLLRRVSQINAGARVRLFVTSRPDYSVLLGFTKIKEAYQEMILHEIERSDIESDIDLYLRHCFQQLREDRCKLPPLQRLAPDWPGPDTHRTLVRRASPLFIFATTIYRLIADPTDDPDSQLLRIIQQQEGLNQLEQTYMPVFQQLMQSTSRDEKAVAQDFMNVLGPIVTFADPLSVISMSKLLQTKATTISQRLLMLRSVLKVPQDPDTPVRTFHASFRDFLVDSTRHESPFWINEQHTHDFLAVKCLELLSDPCHLKENICNQESLGVKRRDVRDEDISAAIPAEVAYACRQWVYHLREAGQNLVDDGTVHRFLRTCFLYWIEALSWLGSLSSIISFLSLLRSLATSPQASKVADFLDDAKRFALQSRLIIDLAPRQVYASLSFTPHSSIIKNTFYDSVKLPITCIPQVDDTWSLELQKLEGHDDEVLAVAFSPDSQLLASTSHDRTVRLWDPATGEQVQQLEGHEGSVQAVAFSPNGQLASASYDRTIRLWDPVIGEPGKQVQQLKGHDDWFMEVAFSPNGQLLASASSDDIVRLWDPATGEQKELYEVNSVSISFSHDGKYIVTDTGRIDLPPEYIQASSTVQMTGAQTVTVGDRWIQYNNSDLIWLPHEWRRMCSSISGGQGAIGSRSGRLTFLKFA